LFVDDEDSIEKMGGQTLERLGYTVSIRTSSIETFCKKECPVGLGFI